MTITKEIIVQNIANAERQVEATKYQAAVMVGKAEGALDLLKQQLAAIEADEKAAAQPAPPEPKKIGRPKGSPNKKKNAQPVAAAPEATQVA